MNNFIKTILKEGVRGDENQFDFDFNEDKQDDILKLKFNPVRKTTRKVGDTTYNYYYAYNLDKSTLSGELMKSIKMLDSNINKNSLRMFVNKAVMGFLHNRKDDYDTIIVPASSSLILREVSDQLKNKIGNINIINEAFIKSLNTDITFDKEQLSKVKDMKTQKDFMKIYNKIITSDKPFKMKEIFAPFRKFLTNFIFLNNENDRKVINNITNKNIVLIDDYKTTGTTLKAMLDKLIDMGAKNVSVFIILKVN